jgi:hypothetical protein
MNFKLALPSFAEEMAKIALSTLDGRRSGMGGLPRPQAPTQASINPMSSQVKKLNQVGTPRVGGLTGGKNVSSLSRV